MVEGIKTTFQLGDLTLEPEALPLAGYGLLLGVSLALPQRLEFGLRLAERTLGQGQRLLDLGQLRLPLGQQLNRFLQPRLEFRKGIAGLRQPCVQSLNVLIQAAMLTLGLQAAVLRAGAIGLLGRLAALRVQRSQPSDF